MTKAQAHTVLAHAHQRVLASRPNWREDRVGAEVAFDAACILFEKECAVYAECQLERAPVSRTIH